MSDEFPDPGVAATSARRHHDVGATSAQYRVPASDPAWLPPLDRENRSRRTRGLAPLSAEEFARVADLRRAYTDAPTPEERADARRALDDFEASFLPPNRRPGRIPPWVASLAGAAQASRRPLGAVESSPEVTR